MFDLTKSKILKNLQEWVDEVKSYVPNDYLCILIIGTFT